MGKITNILIGTLITTGAGFGSYQKAVESYAPKNPPPSSYDVLVWLVNFHDPLASIGALIALGLGALSAYQAVTALTKGEVKDIVETDGEKTRAEGLQQGQTTIRRFDQADEQRWADREAADQREEEAKAERRDIKEGVSNLADYLIAQNQQLAADLGASNERLINLAELVASKVSDPASAADYLQGALDRLKQLEAEGKQGTNFGGLIDQVIAEIFTAIDDEDIAGARTKGAAAFEQLKAQQQELAAAKEKVVDTNIQTALLDLDVDGALHWVLQKLALQSGGAPSLDDLRSEMRNWYELALNRGLRLEMDLAIAVARHNIKMTDDPEERAMCQNDLGTVLAEQGERSSGEKGLKLLQDAVKAYRAALEIRTKDTMPDDWAMTQNNLGNALQEQGSRSEEKGLQLLQDAVKAYRAALEIYTEDAMPADWAMTQNNLGIAYVRIADLHDIATDKITSLEQAATCFRAALTVFDSSNMPYNFDKAIRALQAVESQLAALRDGGDVSGVTA